MVWLNYQLELPISVEEKMNSLQILQQVVELQDNMGSDDEALEKVLVGLGLMVGPDKVLALQSAYMAHAKKARLAGTKWGSLSLGLGIFCAGLPSTSVTAALEPIFIFGGLCWLIWVWVSNSGWMIDVIMTDIEYNLTLSGHTREQKIALIKRHLIEAITRARDELIGDRAELTLKRKAMKAELEGVEQLIHDLSALEMKSQGTPELAPIQEGLRRARQREREGTARLKVADTNHELIERRFAAYQVTINRLDVLQQGPALLRELSQREESLAKAAEEMDRAMVHALVEFAEGVRGLPEALLHIRRALAQDAELALPPELLRPPPLPAGVYAEICTEVDAPLPLAAL